ncbi:hypothetical protein F4823DRAFT_560839 [Ustulina deusta]|nr:hypothetical protein F4823DRAFT_560839 [Ustulina deusta]
MDVHLVRGEHVDQDSYISTVMIFRQLLLALILLHVLPAQTLGGVVIPGIQSERG